MDSVVDHRDRSPFERAQRTDLMNWIVSGFDQRDRLIIILYYYEQMTMREIGTTLGISESRVSQRLESILQRLRARCAAPDSAERFNVA